MICVYPADCTDFSTNGNGVLAPLTAQVTETLNGEYELQIAHPIDAEGKWQRLVEGCILRAPVPAAMTPEVRLSASETTTAVPNSPAGQIYKASKRKILHIGPSLESTIIGVYQTNDRVVVLSQPHVQWYEVTAPDGKHGYMDTTGLSLDKDGETVEEAVEEVVEPRQLRDQPFRIYRVVPELDKVTAYARHISYDLMDNMIQTYKPAATDTGATVFQGVSSHCLSEHPFTFYSDLDSTAEEVEFTNINPLDAVMGDEGIIAKYGGELARDWFDVFLVKRVGVDSNVQIRQGKNLLGVSYDVDLSDVATRIMPTGQDKDGKVLYLPEVSVDSPLIDSYPHPRWIHLEVSEAKEVTSGDDKKTKAQCYEAMREAVQAQFDAGCDLPNVTLNVDFINCADTEEYREYGFLQNIYLGDAVRVIAPRIGVWVSMRMTQYTYDCLTRKYTQMTLGTAADTVEGNMISARQLPTGLISGSKLAIDSVGSGALRDGSVGSVQIQMAAIQTAHIEDAAITRAKIGQAAIGTAQIEDAQITRAKIADAAIGSAQIEEASIDTAHIKDAAIETAKIDDLAVTGAKIAQATITQAKMAQASIGLAQIIDLSVEAAKIADLAVQTAKIADLAVATGKIADLAVDTGKIKDLAVTTAKIGNLAVDTAKIAQAAITEAKIGELAVTSAKIADGAITNAKIGNLAVDTAKIALGAITTALIDSGAVGEAQIANGSITDAKIVTLNANKINAGTLSVERLIISGSEQSLVFAINNMGQLVSQQVDTIDAYALTPRTITADKIVAAAITAAEIASETILANNIAAGAITTAKLHAEAVTADKIKAGEITTDKVASNFGEALNLSSNESIHSVVRDAKSDVLDTADERYATADEVGDLSDTVTDLSSEITQTKEDVVIKFTAAEQYTDDSVRGANDYISEAQSYFRFSAADGLEIGVLGSEFTAKFTNTRLSFLQNGQEIAYVSNKKLHITDAEATKFSAGTASNGYLDFVSVADGVGFVWRD